METRRTKKRFFTRACVGFALCVPLTSCVLFGGGEGDPQPQKAKGYALEAPKSWAEKERLKSDSAFELPHGGKVSVSSSCEKEVVGSLEVLTRHLLFGQRKITWIAQERVPFRNTEALRSQLKAEFEGKKLEFEILVTVVKSCIFDFSLVAERAIHPDDRAQFRNFVQTFQVQE